MQIRIRHISRRRKGIVVQNELITDKQSISIGRATDQDVFLSDLGVAYRHARLTVSADGQIGITSLTTAGIYCNGRLSQSASSKGQAWFQVGPYNIEVASKHDGYDFDITVEQVAEDFIEKQSEELPSMRLEDTWLSRRRGAWTGFVLVLLLFMALPLAGYLHTPAQEVVKQQPWLPDDSVWQSGDISAPHRHFADNCNACHVKAFEMTPDAACIECHAATTSHADPEIFDLHALQGLRCADCHKEHNGDAYLVRKDQALCSDCHRDLAGQVDTELTNIADFSETHPEFRPMLFSPVTAEWQRVSLDASEVAHETGIKFPHDTHLDVNGLESPRGNRVLQCEDCHQTDAGNSYMLPIEFEQHCQECHNLTFDEAVPERELPHSNLDAMTATLDEFYAYMALRGGYENDADSGIPEVVSRRRIPGKPVRPLTAAERKTALAWAEEKAADVKEELIEFRACGYCHKMERDATTASGWRVPKVRISQRWFQKGLFDHAAHTATACQECHLAGESHVSEEVLMPAIDSCRDCHGDEYSTDKLQSGCVTCHVFHVPDNVLLGNRER